MNFRYFPQISASQAALIATTSHKWLQFVTRFFIFQQKRRLQNEYPSAKNFAPRRPPCSSSRRRAVPRRTDCVSAPRRRPCPHPCRSQIRPARSTLYARTIMRRLCIFLLSARLIYRAQAYLSHAGRFRHARRFTVPASAVARQKDALRPQGVRSTGAGSA